MMDTVKRPLNAFLQPVSVSPRGFYYSETIKPEGVETIQQTLTNLSMNVRGGDQQRRSWIYQKRIIETARLCFPTTLGHWIRAQQKSPYLYGRRVDCLFDLIAFIDTGKRSLSVRSWYEVLEDHPISASAFQLTALQERVLGKSRWFHRPFKETLVAWCSQPSGIEDMLWTLVVFFGSEKPHIETHQPDRQPPFSPVKPL